MFSTIVFTLFAVSSFLCVQAQSSAAGSSPALPTSIGSVPPCVLNCTTTAASQAGCSSITNLTCVCTSTKFQSSALACLQADCSASDQASANQLQGSLCASASSGAPTASGTASSSKAPASSGSASATAPASTGSASASSSASASAKPNAASFNVGLGMGHVVGFVAILAGVVTGTLM